MNWYKQSQENKTSSEFIAKIIAIAFEKLEQNFKIEDILKLTFNNIKRHSDNVDRYFNEAFNNLNKGMEANEILRNLGKNFNLDFFGNKGDSVIFDPLIHKDVDGGVLPGDSVEIINCGFKYNGRVIKRVDIKK